MPGSFDSLSSEELTRRLAYAGFVFIGFELLKSMIVGPIKAFYSDTKFHGGPFQSYERDVRGRARDEFEACLLYLRDFMQAITADDVNTIQEMRQHRNELAHNFVAVLPRLQPNRYRPLWHKVDQTLFDLSNYRTRMETGADPAFGDVDWDIVKGHEYCLFEGIVERVKLLT
ncbi:MAG: hypothetical protein WC058_14665 [Phycisphaeraceae bacterium]